MKESIALVLITSGMTLLAQESPAEKVAAFIQSPPPIREMVAECDWDARGNKYTNWIVLCWQTNAYILRDAHERVGLYDVFKTNRESQITVRSGDTYSVVSHYKGWGVHTKQIGRTGPARVESSNRRLPARSDRDSVTHQIRGQEQQAGFALALGIPIPPGSITITNGAFSYHDPMFNTTLSGVIEVDERKMVTGVRMTNRVDRTTEGEGVTLIPMSIRYTYGGSMQPTWFPHEITRDVVIRGETLHACRIVIHRLEFGVLPASVFDPNRFLEP